MSDAAEAAPDPWEDAMLALALFAVDPAGLGGVALRAQAGPVRDRFLTLLRQALPAAQALRKMPAAIPDGRLLGGLDLGATLQAGRPVAERGLLAEADGGVLLLAMAERLPAGTAAKLAATLDSGTVATERDGIAQRHSARIGIVALDEGAGDDEALCPALRDRLAFHTDIGAIAWRDAAAAPGSAAAIAAARMMLPGVAVGDGLIEALCETAAALGIASLRAPMLALRVTRAAAAMAGREKATAEDAALAARLVLAPRATRLPQAPPDDAERQEPEFPETQDPPDDPGNDDEQQNEDEQQKEGPLGEIVLEAARAAIPKGLLQQIQLSGHHTARHQKQGRQGAAQKGGMRGRPAGIRAGDPGCGQRLNLIETLRAAAPWQRLRGATPGGQVALRREDFRITRMEQRARTTTIFVVDASGSSALNRLAEAKGAVELLLADCYLRRDQVAVLAFRGRGAQLLLPPTRSLVRAKRSLATLPGGGGTPLAAGIEAGFLLALTLRRGGITPTLVLLTDGRANVGRTGTGTSTGGRAQASQDATAAGRLVRANRIGALLVDTSPRAAPEAKALASEMGALYLPLPYADAAALSRSVRAATQANRA